MPTWLKIVLIVFAVFLACLTSGAILLYRYVTTHQKEWQQGTVDAGKEGEEFGKGKRLDACVSESLHRADGCAPMAVACEARARFFLQHCALTAEMPADFCTTTPKQSEILRSAQWAAAECARRDRANVQRCSRILPALQDYCGER